ncbi:MAG: hypothetical protein FWC68_01105 [Oscillospiraceae bacterium]|nr:hypothetical protein [Oscillospiraceae bacterium]
MSILISRAPIGWCFYYVKESDEMEIMVDTRMLNENLRIQQETTREIQRQTQAIGQQKSVVL